MIRLASVMVTNKVSSPSLNAKYSSCDDEFDLKTRNLLVNSQSRKVATVVSFDLNKLSFSFSKYLILNTKPRFLTGSKFSPL